jgi:transposase
VARLRQALYRRKKSQLGHRKALGAVMHSIICPCWHMLSTGELYRDLGGDHFARRDARAADETSRRST